MTQGSVQEDSSNHVRPRSKVLSNGLPLQNQDEDIGKNGLEPVAVIGFSLRFPQDAVSADSFWKMLLEKRCAMTEFPEDRINLNGFYNADADRSDTVIVFRLSSWPFHAR